MKRIKVVVFPIGTDSNAVKMQIVPKSEARAYLASLEKSLSRMRPEHRRGSSIFTIADKPGSELERIADLIDPELFSVTLKKREVPKVSKHARLLELDTQRGLLREELRALNKEARNIERRLARKLR